MRTITVNTGPATGRTFEITDETVIGREGTQIELDDPELSRQHVRLRPTPEGLVIEDLGSLNGTFVNGERITGPTLVSGQATIGLGRSEFSVSDPGQSELPSPGAGAQRTHPASLSPELQSTRMTSPPPELQSTRMTSPPADLQSTRMTSPPPAFQSTRVADTASLLDPSTAGATAATGPDPLVDLDQPTRARAVVSGQAAPPGAPSAPAEPGAPARPGAPAGPDGPAGPGGPAAGSPPPGPRPRPGRRIAAAVAAGVALVAAAIVAVVLLSSGGATSHRLDLNGVVALIQQIGQTGAPGSSQVEAAEVTGSPGGGAATLSATVGQGGTFTGTIKVYSTQGSFTIDYSGKAIPQPDKSFLIADSGTVVASTGIYAGASGTAKITGVRHLNNPIGTFHAVGTIKY